VTTALESLCAHAALRGASRTGHGIAWLDERRASALAAFAEQGIPTTRDEDWRFTPLRRFAETAFEPAGNAIPSALPALPELGAVQPLVFVDGRCNAARSRPSALAEALAMALEREPEALRARLGSLADDKTGCFTALNSALFDDGLCVRVPAGQVVAQPICACFVHTGGGQAVHPRSWIELGEGARATVLEIHVGTPEPGLTNALTEIRVGPGARLEHVKLQLEGDATYHLARVAVHQERDSHFAQHSIALGAGLSRVELRSELAGEEALATLRGLYLASGSQHVDHHTTIDHATPHTTSDELYKGVLGGRARGVFHGRIHVRPHAQKIQALQTNRNLLLSDNAVIHTKPQLEIYADDVRCSHGASIGRLDPDALFFLRARGIGEREARALLTLAFAREIATGLPAAELAASVEAYIGRALEPVSGSVQEDA